MSFLKNHPVAGCSERTDSEHCWLGQGVGLRMGTKKESER